MAFWKGNSVEPTRKFRFTVDGSGIWWWIKTIDKPSFEVNTSEYLLLNHKFKYPGVLTWNDITITLITAEPAVLDRILTNIQNSGYYGPDSEADYGIKKDGYDGSSGNLIINQFNQAGEIQEVWTLHNSFVKSIRFGDLAYADDDFVEVQMVISYDFAKFSKDG